MIENGYVQAKNALVARPLVVQCSPHAGGVTDALAGIFAAAAGEAGLEVERLALREYTLRPCIGCGQCLRAPHVCVLAAGDDAEALFARIRAAPLVLFVSPIFFYALPALFKGLIDRGQRFWAAAAARPADDAPLRGHEARKPVLALLAGGRPRGARLFSGALLTLRWFSAALDARLVDSRVFRGLDTCADVRARPEDSETVRRWAAGWARRQQGTDGSGMLSAPPASDVGQMQR